MKRFMMITSLLLTLFLVACTKIEPLKRLDTPKNLIVENNTLIFDPVKHATSYLIVGDGFNEEITTTTYTFTEKGTYKVRVLAKADGYLDSLFSAQVEIIVEDEPGYEITRLDTPSNLKFEDNTLTFDPVEHATSYSIYIGDDVETTQTNSYTFKEDGLHLVSVMAHADGYEDSLLSSEIEVIVVFEDSNPFITSPTNIVTNLKDDIVITFETAGYTFKSLSVTGKDITSSDYSFNDGVLVIKNSFIKAYFEENENETSIIFLYIFEKGNQTRISFITIKK